ncbi:MAG: NADH-quinone oxidoreductase subunit J, partial [Alphaproteobacteria bacterium]|nr:NADH-quinone oxidoreductase subunit J [Alphaproteobacteria bacterium]
RASKWKQAAVEPIAVDPALAQAAVPAAPQVSNIQAIGNVLYTDYVYVFQLAGLILLVAMVGAIVLTLRDKGEAVRRQNIGRQVARRREDAVEVVKVPTGSGVSHV